jgi:hypothetical protein
MNIDPAQLRQADHEYSDPLVEKCRNNQFRSAIANPVNAFWRIDPIRL